MFHSVGNDRSTWHRRYLSVTAAHFERFCHFLSKNNYRTLFFDEWFFLQDYPEKRSGKEIFLNLDDGYLDNWVFAYPILKKYGLKATVFINPEFVDPIDQIRPNIEDARNWKVGQENLQSLGFLSWPEIQKMDSDGVIQAQSHSMTHNFYFYSEELIDFYIGQPEYDWLAWFHASERKPYYITEDQTELVPFGYPIFKYGRALGLRRFSPAESIVELFVGKAKSLKDKGTENDETIKEALFHEARNCLDKNSSWGCFETDQEMEARYRYELYDSKRILEEKLNHPVEYLCWPGGGYDEKSIALSIEAGYKASTIAARDKKIYNNSGNYKRVPRYGTGSFIYKNNRRVPAFLSNHLIHLYKAKKGNVYSRAVLKFEKIFAGIR